MSKASFSLLASIPLLGLLPATEASALSFTTAPATISFVNEFQFNFPSSDYSFTIETTIASAEGAPQLVGKSLVWHDTTRALGFSGALTIDGQSASTVFGGPNASGNGSVQISPQEEFDCTTFAPSCVIKYAGLFNLFNPNAGTPNDSNGSEILPYKFNFAFPTRTGYEYTLGGTCNSFEFSVIGGLTELFGCPVVNEAAFQYIEGRVANATITFGTPSPVPLPAGIWLMGAALGGLGAVRKFRRPAG